MRKSEHQYTGEEISEMHYKNEHFHGKRVNLERAQRFKTIIDTLNGLIDCPDTRAVKYFKPNSREKNCLAWADLSSITMLEADGIAELIKALSLADDVTLCSTKEGIRISFGVRAVWAD